MRRELIAFGDPPPAPMAIFAKQKTKNAEKANDRHTIKAAKGDKYAIPDSARGRIYNDPLCADHRRLFMLCWAARASDATPLLLDDRTRIAHLNGYGKWGQSQVLTLSFEKEKKNSSPFKIQS